jgi:hypothetical protein
LKRTIFILTLVVIISQTGWAQTNKFQLGVNGGPSIAKVRGFDPAFIELDSRTGFSVSATVQFNFSLKLALFSEVGFEQKGFQTKDKFYIIDEFGNPSGSYKLKNSMSYLTVPLMVRYTIGNEKLKGFVNLGGYMGFLIENYIFLEGYEPKEDTKVDTSSEMENMDFGISAGLGGSYSLSEKLNVSFEIRNNLGLYNVNAGTMINGGEHLLNSTNFLIGINYGFGTK